MTAWQKNITALQRTPTYSQTGRASIRNIYSHVLANTHKDSHHTERHNHTRAASIKHPIRPHPIISESTSSLTSHYKTLTHLGVHEHTLQCHYSCSNRVVHVCLLLRVCLLCVSSADGGFTSPGACYWPPVTVPVSCVKSITSWQPSRYGRPLQEHWYGKRYTVAVTQKKDEALQATQWTVQMIIKSWFAAVLHRSTSGVCVCVSVKVWNQSLCLFVQKAITHVTITWPG